jgi:hypothetical protein
MVMINFAFNGDDMLECLVESTNFKHRNFILNNIK